MITRPFETRVIKSHLRIINAIKAQITLALIFSRDFHVKKGKIREQGTKARYSHRSLESQPFLLSQLQEQQESMKVHFFSPYTSFSIFGSFFPLMMTYDNREPLRQQGLLTKWSKWRLCGQKAGARPNEYVITIIRRLVPLK